MKHFIEVTHRACSEVIPELLEKDCDIETACEACAMASIQGFNEKCIEQKVDLTFNQYAEALSVIGTTAIGTVYEAYKQRSIERIAKKIAKIVDDSTK